jgi:hypothetical protein
VQITILRNTITKYMSIKSIIMIIAIAFSGSQAWAKDWTEVKACADAAIKAQKQAACRDPIEATPGSTDMEFMMKFDFNLDGCLPSAGVSKEGVPNPGIEPVGDLDGFCAYRDQLDKANTMYRIRCTWGDGKAYCVRMFALYFVKDQATFGHTNDWEFGLIWTTDNKITHASFSAHGNVCDKPIAELYPKSLDRKDVFINYYKDGAVTHPMRLPDEVNKRKILNPVGK